MTFATAMVPVIELRGAIPVGIAAGLPPAVACVTAILGNLLPVPFIMLLVRRIFDWLRDTRFFGPKIVWLERRAHLKGRIVRKYRLAGLVVLLDESWIHHLLLGWTDNISGMASVHLGMVTVILGEVIYGAVFYILTTWFLKKRLNLE